MKLIECNNRRLTLKSRPWVAWLAGSICGGLGLVLLAVPKPTTQIVCLRTSGYCQITATGLGHSPERRIPIADIHKAQMEVPLAVRQARQRSPQAATRDIYGVVLHTHQEAMAIDYLANASAPEQERVVRQINRFLKDDQSPSLTLNQGVHPAVYGIGAFLMALGGLISVAGQSTRVSFDRPSGLVQITWHRFGTNKVYTCSLAQVAQVELERLIKRPSSPQPIQKEDYGLPPEREAGEYYVYRISLRLVDGNYLPLTAKFMPDLHGGMNTARIVKQIQQFLQEIPLLGEAYGVRMD